MPVFTKRKSKLHIQLTNSDQATAHGGQVLVDALCRRFDLWTRLHNEPSLDPRKRTGAGFSPVANIAQLIFTLTSGGASLADAERVGKDRVLMDLLGLEQGADQSTLGEWLRAQTKESVIALHRINAELVDWSSQQAKPGRWLHAGEVEAFFDDTEMADPLVWPLAVGRDSGWGGRRERTPADSASGTPAPLGRTAQLLLRGQRFQRGQVSQPD
jgi:hypothetical protein